MSKLFYLAEARVDHGLFWRLGSLRCDTVSKAVLNRDKHATRTWEAVRLEQMHKKKKPARVQGEWSRGWRRTETLNR